MHRKQANFVLKKQRPFVAMRIPPRRHTVSRQGIRLSPLGAMEGGHAR
jgi:hypothetical protein